MRPNPSACSCPSLKPAQKFGFSRDSHSRQDSPPRTRLVRSKRSATRINHDSLKQGIARKRFRRSGCLLRRRFGAGSVEISTFFVTMTRFGVGNSARDQTDRNFSLQIREGPRSAQPRDPSFFTSTNEQLLSKLIRGGRQIPS